MGGSRPNVGEGRWTRRGGAPAGLLGACPAAALHCAGAAPPAPDPHPPTPARAQAIPGWDDAEFSSLAWAADPAGRGWRLFAGSLDGAVYEADFARQQLVHASDSYGGAVWALAAAPHSAGAGGAGGAGDGREDGGGGAGAGVELVAACDDGSLRVLRVAERGGGCEYVRSLCKVEGKALAVAWHPDGRTLVSGGSDGAIHVWDYASGGWPRAARGWVEPLDAACASLARPSPGHRPACLAVHALTAPLARPLPCAPKKRQAASCCASPRPPRARRRRACGRCACCPTVRSCRATPMARRSSGRAASGRSCRACSSTWRTCWRSRRAPTGASCTRRASTRGCGRGREGGNALQGAGGPPPPERLSSPAGQPRRGRARTHARRARRHLQPPPPHRPDTQVAVFARVKDAATGAERWSYLAHKSPHTHDVRALVAAPRGGAAAGDDELLISGGADGQLVLYPAARILEEHPVRLTKAPQAPLLQLAPSAPGGAPRLLLAQGRRLGLWRAGRAGAARGDGAAAAANGVDEAGAHHGAHGGAVEAHEGDPLDLAEAPACLAEVVLRGPRHLAAAAVAPDGSRLAASDASGVRVFAVEEGGGGAVAVRRAGRGGEGEGGARRGGSSGGGGAPPAVAMAFSSDGASVYCADAAGCVRCVDAATGRVVGGPLRLGPEADAPAAAARRRRGGAGDSGSNSGGDSDGSESDGSSDDDDDEGPARRGGLDAPPRRSGAAAAAPPVSALAVSPDGRWLAAAAGAGVALVSLGAGGAMAAAGPLLLLGDAAAGGAPPVTALAFSPDSELLAVANAADGVAAYAVATRAPTAWSADHSEPLARLLALLPGTVEGLSWAPAGGARSLLVRSAGGVAHVELDAPLSADVLSAKRRRGPHKPRPGAAAAAAGRNGRVLGLESPCLFFGYIGRGAALLVERPWEEVAAALPPPLARHKYGT
jgi:WD40 repeat protein